MEKYYLLNLGCPKNLVDSEVMAKKLIDDGYVPVSHPSEADFIVINTCGFIDESRKENMRIINNLSKLGKKIVVLGCLPEIESKIPADVVGGVGLYDKISEIVKMPSGTVLKGNKNYMYSYIDRINTLSPFSAYVKISEGCSRSCAFCSIPIIKGKMRSRPKEDIEEELKRLANLGVEEIILVSQDTVRWGWERGEKLPELISSIKKYVSWIRLFYIYPDLGDDILSLFYDEKVVKYIEIPFQHYDTDILRAMKRGYDEKKIDIIMEKLKRIPGISIRTELIVGFPGETDEKFEKLVKFLDYDFDWIGVFVYSPEFDGKRDVPLKVAKERRKYLYSIWYDKFLKKQKERIGKRYKVILERDGIGRTYFQAPEIDGVVKVEGVKLCSGPFVDVEITGFEGLDLFGKM